MPQVDRFTVSLDTELLAAFDRHIAAKGYQNRSEAVRDLIRDLLITSRLKRGDEAITAFLTFACDHRVGEAFERVRECLLRDTDLLQGSLHLVVDDHRDGLAIGLRGSAARVQALANDIQALRGVSHGHLTTLPVEE